MGQTKKRKKERAKSKIVKERKKETNKQTKKEKEDNKTKLLKCELMRRAILKDCHPESNKLDGKIFEHCQN